MRVLLLIALSALALPHAARGDEAGALEIAAARWMTVWHSSSDLAIDSAFAAPGRTPGIPTVRRRDPRRMAALLRELDGAGASGRTRRGVYLILSDPVARGAVGSVTVTAWYPTGNRGRPWEFDTRQLTLRRTSGGWNVVDQTQTVGAGR